LEKEKQQSTSTRATPESDKGGRAVTSDAVPVGKDNKVSDTKQENEGKNEAEREKFFNNAYHMSYEEYLDYNSTILPELLRKYSNFDDQEFYTLIFDTLKLQEKGNDTEGEKPGDDRGSEILPEQKSDEQSGAETNKDQSAETGVRVQSNHEEGSVPESPSGRIDKTEKSETAEATERAIGEVHQEARRDVVHLTKEEADDLVSRMENEAEIIQDKELTVKT